MAETNQERMQRRKKTEPWLLWQNTVRWKALRQSIFERDGFTCQCGCGVVECDTTQLVARHRAPHEGDERLFWDQNNIQTLRKPCSARRPLSNARFKRGVWT